MRLLLSLFLLTLDVSSAIQQELLGGTAILQDLSSYSKLYVTYQNCEWSSYPNGCGVAAGDGSYWYMGLTDCFRANVAYSLFGVLKGQDDKGCNKASFINSFFTTTGIESFTTYMANAGVAFTDNGGSQITSDCTVVQNQNNGNNNQGNAVNYNANNVKVYASATSYGVGCSGNDKRFVLKDYSGAYCDERAAIDVKDSLDTFNNDIDKVQCVAIYDASGTDASGLLQYSQACDIRLFPDTCPDPYGILQSTARSSSHSQASAAYPRREMVKTVFSWFFLGFGIILTIASAWAYFRKMQAQEVAKKSKNKKSNKKGLFSRSASRSQDGGDTSAGHRPGFFGRVRSMLSRS